MTRPLLATASLGCLLAMISACSSTPGDAALRGGHSYAAAKLYRQGADQGDKSAALKLGLLLMQTPMPGYGSPGQWFVRGCELGSEAACHNAGVGHEYGDQGLSKDYGEAKRYYLVAAQHGYMQSKYNLGSLYSNSYFTDDVEGLAWLLAAQAQANQCLPDPMCKWIVSDEPGHVARLKVRMTPAQIAESEIKAKPRASGG